MLSKINFAYKAPVTPPALEPPAAPKNRPGPGNIKFPTYAPMIPPHNTPPIPPNATTIYKKKIKNRFFYF